MFFNDLEIKLINNFYLICLISNIYLKMLVLFETPAGYAIFRISDEKKLTEPENIASLFATTELSQKK